MKFRKLASAVIAAAVTAPFLVSVLPAAAAQVPVSPGLARDLATKVDGAPEEFFVHFKSGDAGEQALGLAARGMKVIDVFERIDAAFVVGNVGHVKALRSQSDIVYLEDNAKLREADATSNWAVRSTAGSEPVFGGAYRDAAGEVLDGSGVGVAIVDSGIDSPHPDLANRIVKNYKVECSFVLEYSDTGRCAPGPIEMDPGVPSDTSSGHGTHVAGIIAGDGTASNGTFKGQAPGAGLYAFGTGEGINVLFAVESYEFILDNQATFNPAIRVINNSYGNPAGTAYNANGALEKLVNQAAAAGIVSVFAAGNDGSNADTGSADDMSGYAKNPTPGVITVANYDDNSLGSRDYTLSTSSSRGKKGTPANYPDISAPGSSITSTCNPRLTLCAANPGEAYAPHYSYMGGTSMATPHIVGIVALLLQAHPELTPAQVEDALQDTAYKFSGGTGAPGLYEADPQNAGGTISYDKGAGLADVPALLDSLGTARDGAPSSPAVKITSPTSGTEQEGSVVVTGTAKDGTPLSAPVAGRLIDDPAGDYNGGPKAADLIALDVTESADGVTYVWKLADITDTGATNIGLRVTQKINGVQYFTNVSITSTAVTSSAASSTNNAVATSVSRDVATNTITAFVPWANLGNPAAGSPAYNVFASSFIGAINDVAPGGGGGDGISKPQYAAYTMRRATPVTPPTASVLVSIDSGSPVTATLSGTSPSYTWSAGLDLSALTPGAHTVTSSLILDGVPRASNQIMVMVPEPTVYTAAITSPADGSTVFRSPGVVTGTTSVNKPITGTHAVTVQVTATGYDSGQIAAAGLETWTVDVDYSAIAAATATVTARYKVNGNTVASDSVNVDLTDSLQVIRTVVCGTADDAGAIQAAIDASSAGDTVALSGTCDLSSVAPHGGNIWSITDAAVLVDKAITLTSAGTPRSAILRGNGRQAAVLVGPSGDGAIIKALTFEQVGRAIVVWNASNVTIGASGAINNPNANRITGGPTMNQAILALSNTIGADEVSGRAIVNVAGRDGNVTLPFAGQKLTGLNVLGNYVSWTAVGPPDPTAYDVVAIDVRQRTAGAKDIVVRSNAVGMGGSEFPSVNMNGVRVYSHALEAIENVTVDGNNLGRNEDLAGTAADPAADVQAAGRVGILIHRVKTFSVDGNGVRVRLSPTGVPMPGGGIVIADSSDGHVNGNGIISLADPSTAPADLGAIGVIDQFSDLFNGRTDVLPTSDVTIQGNIVGFTTNDSPSIGAQKGIVLNGVTRPLVSDNIIKLSTLDAINIGTPVEGPGDTSSPGIKAVKGLVTEGIICHNYLDVDGSDPYSYDDQSEVTAQAVRYSAFPGGYSANNSSCFPTLTLNPATGPVGPNKDIVATVAAMPNTDLMVNLFDEDFGTPTSSPNIQKNVVVGPTGRIDVTFTAAELQGQKDGQLTIAAFVYFGDINYQDSKIITLAAHPTALPVGTVTLADGGDGFTNAAEAHANIPVTWTKANDARVKGVTVWFADAAGFIPAGCGPASNFGPTGAGYLNATCADNLPQGPYTFNAQWSGDGGTLSARVSVTSIKDTVANAPTITSPASGFEANTDTVSVSGTADSDNAVKVKVGGQENTVVVGSDGAWTTQFTLPDGGYSITATSTDPAGNSATSAPTTIRVITTSVAPDAPVITSPANNSDVPGTFTVSGTAVAGLTVIAKADGTEWKRTVASSTGTWNLNGTLADGSHSFEVTVVDTLDRSSSAATLTLNVDGTKPVAAVVSPSPVFLPGQAVLTGTATDNLRVARISIQLSNAATGANVGAPVEATCTGCGTATASWTYTVTAPRGAYGATVTAIDTAGNVSTAQRVTFVTSG